MTANVALRSTHTKPLPRRSPARAEALDLLTNIVRAAVAMPWEDPATDGAEEIADDAYRLAHLLGLDALTGGDYDEPVFR